MKILPFYENKTGKIQAGETSNLNFPPHLHDAIECIYVLSGKIDITIESTCYTVYAGSIALVFPNMVHAYSSDPLLDNRYQLFIYPHQATSQLHRLMHNQKPTHPILTSKTLHPLVSQHLIEIIDLCHQPSPNSLLIDTLAQLTFLRMFEDLKLIPRDLQTDDTLGKAVVYISEHFRDSLSLDHLAHHLGVSKYHLSRTLKSALDMDLRTYINNLRIDHAKALLATTTNSISSIGMDSGYDQLRSFNRSFKQLTGQTPMEYRKNIKAFDEKKQSLNE